jgi:tetratricopeptide (TPR) repeat protein
VSERLAAEFREVLPRSLLVAAENDLFTLDFTAQWIDVVTRYIVGIASLISGDLTYSEDLFKRLENELGTHEGSLPQSIAVIRNRIPQRLAEVYKVRVNGLADAYRLKRESRLLEEVEPWLDKLREYDDSYYMGHLQRAICAFVLRRDIAGARAALDKCRRVPEPTWRYSLAFLYAYEGDLQRAYREYNRAFRVPPREPSVPVQAEEFIHLILDEEPHKSQLYFCLGMINQHAKMDMSAAQRDFERFLATTAPDQFAEEQKVVQTWLKKINMPRGQY